MSIKIFLLAAMASLVSSVSADPPETCEARLAAALLGTAPISQKSIDLPWSKIGTNKKTLLLWLLSERGLAQSLRPPLDFRKFRLGLTDADFARLPVTESAHVEGVQSVYDYGPTTGDVFRVYVNFANSDLFSMWKMDFLTQDDIQVIEHPALAYLRETWLESNPEALILDKDLHEVALLTNVARMGALFSEEIYGRAFAAASEYDLSLHLTKFANSKPSNLLAMAAKQVPKEMAGQFYREEDVRYHLRVAVTAFTAAKVEAGARKLVLHTGNWGSGAFGNDPQMMAMIQIVAAHVAGVDDLVYHTVSADRHEAFRQARALVARIHALWKAEKGARPLGDWVQALVATERTYGRRGGK